MGENLVIRLDHANANNADWAVVDDLGALVHGPMSGPLSGAAYLAGGRRVLALVPATRVLRVTAEVPVRGAARVVQALPFALEDMLADDVDELHFAAGPRQADGRIPAAAVRRQYMETWLGHLQAAGIDVSGIYADSDGLGDVPSTTTLLLEDHQVILRDPGGDAVATEADGLEGLLELWLAQERPPAVDGALPARHLLVYDVTTGVATDELWERFRPRLQSLEVRRLADGALPRLAATVALGSGVNLLQAGYLRRSTLASYWPRWRLVAGLTIAVIGTLLATAGADLWRLKRESAALDQAINQAFQFTFPGSGAVTDPRAQFDERVKRLGQSGGAGHQFLDALRSVADAVKQTGDAKVQSVNYRSGIIELQVLAPSAETLDKIRQLVANQGKLKAEIQSANASGDQIQGRLRITVGGA